MPKQRQFRVKPVSISKEILFSQLKRGVKSKWSPFAQKPRYSEQIESGVFVIAVCLAKALLEQSAKSYNFMDILEATTSFCKENGAAHLHPFKPKAHDRAS